MIKQKTVFLGLSGGVDSAVAAHLLQKSRFKVIGAFIRCFSDSKDLLSGQCSWVSERKSAQKICALLKIPLVTLNFEKEYKDLVIKPMIESYRKGKTPNPDIACNTIIKFPLLWKASRKYKADYIATGHYAKLSKTSSGFKLKIPKDKTKDQTYFLSDLSQKDLSHTLFPLSDLKKEEVRKLAKSLGFPNHNKQGTRGICFIGKMNFQSFLKNKISKRPGKVKTPDNKIIGTHPGAMYFTIGQRIGPRLGISLDKSLERASTERYYVVDKKGNTLTVAQGSHKALKKSLISLKKFHEINPKSKIPRELKARIRHLGPLLPGTLMKTSSGFKFKLSRSRDSIAPGQALVLYKNSELIASAEITKAK
jgi:tRNA-uridine 2-sulfurtransferase